MTKGFCLCGCGEVLAGKQRMFTSDACRMRYKRQHNKSEQNCSVLFANRSVLTFRQVEVRLSVNVVFEVQWGGDLDETLINRPIRAKIGPFLTAFLSQHHPDARILAVKVEKVG